MPAGLHRGLFGAGGGGDLTLSKAQIITRGTALGVPWPLTVSCYQADSQGRACGRCDSCRLRREGFLAAGQVDPTRYQ